jgi:class 3 adenylate cyclase
MDRRQAIARGEWLPDRMAGAALFADISGFTPLTEALHIKHGPKRGAEELTRQLNLIYDALVTEVHRYGGSVLAFSGDAITCWFDGDDGLRAAGCGLSMQQAIASSGLSKPPPAKPSPWR